MDGEDNEPIFYFEILEILEDGVVVEINGERLVMVVGNTLVILREVVDDDNARFRDTCH